jgi:hypothetical protein
VHSVKCLTAYGRVCVCSFNSAVQLGQVWSVCCQLVTFTEPHKATDTNKVISSKAIRIRPPERTACYVVAIRSAIFSLRYWSVQVESRSIIIFMHRYCQMLLKLHPLSLNLPANSCCSGRGHHVALNRRDPFAH